MVIRVESGKQKICFRLENENDLPNIQCRNVVREGALYGGPSIQGNNYEIFVNLFHISHNLTWYSAIVHRFTRIYPVCSTYDLTKQFMQISLKNWAIDLKKNDL